MLPDTENDEPENEKLGNWFYIERIVLWIFTVVMGITFLWLLATKAVRSTKEIKASTALAYEYTKTPRIEVGGRNGSKFILLYPTNSPPQDIDEMTRQMGRAMDVVENNKQAFSTNELADLKKEVHDSAWSEATKQLFELIRDGRVRRLGTNDPIGSNTVVSNCLIVAEGNFRLEGNNSTITHCVISAHPSYTELDSLASIPGKDYTSFFFTLRELSVTNRNGTITNPVPNVSQPKQKSIGYDPSN